MTDLEDSLQQSTMAPSTHGIVNILHSQLVCPISFLKSGLAEGLHYTFRAFSLNFNGKSQPSQTASFYACVAPTGFKKPAIAEQSPSYITISW